MSTARVATYNVLAQTLATSRYFPYSGSALQAKHRLPALTGRLLGLRADVIGISEAYPEVLASLHANGYESLFVPRVKREYGVALAYHSGRVELLQSAALDFDDVADSLIGNQGDVGGGADTFRTNSVAVFGAFRVIGAPTGEGVFVVAEAHLHWNPAQELVKSAQAVALKRAAAEFAAAHAPAKAPLIIVGDFNSMPGSWTCSILEARGGVLRTETGAAAEALVSGWNSRLPARDNDAVIAWHARLRTALAAEVGVPVPTSWPGGARPADVDDAGDAGAASDGVSDDCGTLCSAYALAGRENQITTHTATFSACLDYIYVEVKRARLRGASDGGLLRSVERVPEKGDLKGPIPSAEEPSDHLPLVAEFFV